MMMTINQARGLRASDRDRVACICSRNTDTSRKRSGVIDVSVLPTASRTRLRPDGPERDDVSFEIVIPPQVAESTILPTLYTFRDHAPAAHSMPVVSRGPPGLADHGATIWPDGPCPVSSGTPLSKAAWLRSVCGSDTTSMPGSHSSA